MATDNSAIEFKIIRHLGTLATYQTGWNKEANVIEWNGGVAKVDIRDWSPDHERMTRGITLHMEEAKNLVKILSDKL